MRRSDREITDMDRIMEIVRKASVRRDVFRGYAMSVFNSNELWGGPGKRAADTVFPWSGCGDQAGPAQCGSPCFVHHRGGSQVSLNFEEACRSTAGFDSVCGTGRQSSFRQRRKEKAWR